MIQIDVSNSLIRNIKNFREKERQRFKFSDVKIVLEDDLNPLSLTIEFNNFQPFELYMYSPSQRNDLVKLVSDIIKNTAAKKDTQLNINENLLKEGGADYKKKTIGWDRRYLYLYPLYLHCFSQDNADVSRHVINLFSTPISKEAEKMICIHSNLQPYTFRFDTVEQRDLWFTMLIKASHNEGYEWSSLSEDVDFTTEYENVKKDAESAAQQVRTAIVQNTVSAREKDTLSRDLESARITRKNAQADNVRIAEEKKGLETKFTELDGRSRELKSLVEKATATLAQTESAKQQVEDRYRSSHELFLVIQANYNLVNGDLLAVMQQLQEVENAARQLDVTIADMQKSPELIAAQIVQVQRETGIAHERTKMEESKILVLTESEKDIDEKIAALERRKEEALKMKQSAVDMVQAAKSEAESQQLQTNLLRTEVDLVVDKERNTHKELQQIKDLTAAALLQTESLRQELVALA